VVAIVGGAKVSSKIDLLMNLVGKVDALVIGGGMANTFLAAQGKDVGKSLCEHDLAETAAIMIEAATAGCAIVLPVDAVVAKEFKEMPPTSGHRQVPADRMILDLGPKSSASGSRVDRPRRTLVWNGPLGAFEIEPFDKATVAAPNRPPTARGTRRLVSSPAAATRWPRSTMPAWRRISPMSRRPAAPSSNGWKARNCPASRRWSAKLRILRH
jgi:phosphoglycerate kinase